MWESVAAPVVGLLAAVAVAAPTPTPARPVDAAPVLTSTPFGALPGQQVTHVVTISGGGTLTNTRVTFTTTADLDGVTASAEPGRCTASPRTVVCELGDLRLGTAPSVPKITIAGRVRPGVPPGTLVRNRVSVTSVESTATGAQFASNAYLLPGATATPTDPALESPVASEALPGGRSMRVPAVAAVVVAGAVAAAAVLTRRRLRLRHGPPPAGGL
ncbi:MULTISPECIES: hypothetical protein [Micromonospora]|jgi:hypothetical protein|uniref:DUF11 domain-containing protein n=1 Tax=Micromonospora sicca TaxID=2202420 RepID=A0A317D0Q5_9ACTN|nr:MULTISPECIES: hypothetical protein [unclassified Micromonospora]MBM0226905.1 hypothetical protein [Micromonospora sp. ATA51]PWR08084.1 hypothetical protein DKT69_33425 [Micromonospora sp. 4G51]